MQVEETVGGNEEVLSSTESAVEGANEATVTESEATLDSSDAGGFSSKFAAARARAFSDKSEAEETQTDSEQVSTKTSDAQVPEETESDDEESAEEKTDEEESKEAEKQSEDDTEEEKTASRRGENFRKVTEERDTLLSANAELQTRLDKFEQNFEKFGGLDSVETALEVANTLSDPTKIKEFADIIGKLPHRAAIQKTFFDNALSLEANRIYGVNQVLMTDFGLSSGLTQDRMEKSFEFIVQKYNEDPEEFDQFLERELELANTPENELKRTRAELERLKNPKTAKTADQTQEFESDQDLHQRIQKTHDEFEDTQFEAISNEVAADYGLNVSKNDTPAIKEAKEFLLEAVKFKVAVEMRTAKAHESLLGYWIVNQTDSPFYNQAVKNYKAALKVKTQNSLKQISRLLGARTAKEVKKDTTLENLTDQNKARTDLPPKTEKKTESKGFRAAFQAAKRSALS